MLRQSLWVWIIIRSCTHTWVRMRSYLWVITHCSGLWLRARGWSSCLASWVFSQWACLLPLLPPGLSGDDFLAVGLRSGRVVYSYNLGSGTASVSSDPLDLSHGIHTVHLGRSFRAGWLKVKGHPSICPTILLRAAVLSDLCWGTEVKEPGRLPPWISQTSAQNRRLGCVAVKWCGDKLEGD